jgi:hypothetical protein
MTSLRQLYLNNNQIKVLPSSLAKLTSLHTLALSGNPLLGRFARDAVGSEKCGEFLGNIAEHFGRRERCMDAIVTLKLIAGAYHVRLFLPPEIMHMVCEYLFWSRFDDMWELDEGWDSEGDEERGSEHHRRLEGRWADVDETEM